MNSNNQNLISLWMKLNKPSLFHPKKIEVSKATFSEHTFRHLKKSHGPSSWTSLEGFLPLFNMYGKLVEGTGWRGIISPPVRRQASSFVNTWCNESLDGCFSENSGVFPNQSLKK